MRRYNSHAVHGGLLASCCLLLSVAFWPATLIAQAKKPSFPNLPGFPRPGSNSGIGQQLAEAGLSRTLNDQLPLKLDANAIYPTVAAPPGGPFAPHPLALTAANIDQPLPPGDYTVNVLAFCTEYSVHRPGAGIAYRLGPLQGRAAGAIGDLLWRGTLEKNRSPQQLQAVSWAIQSGLRYSQMPNTYQAVIDDVIPDHKPELNGDFMQSMEDSYAAYAKSAKLPPLEQMFAKMGKPGELALSARKQRDALLRQNTSDQIKEQTLFAGQEAGVYTPVKAEEGPWTERIPGVAYMRYKIVGGNMAANNVMEIRILPRAGSVAKKTRPAQLVYANYEADTLPFEAMPGVEVTTPSMLATITNLIHGSIGCAVGQGAQCLVPIPGFITPPQGPVKSMAALAAGAVGAATEVDGDSNYGDVTIIHNGVSKPLTPGTPIFPGDSIYMGGFQHAQLSFEDGTQITLGTGVLESISLQVNNYNYDQNNPANNQASYTWSGGVMQWFGGLMDNRPYVSGAVGKPVPVNINEQWIGSIGIRGTEFIATRDKVTGAVELDLIKGALDVTPKAKPKTSSFTAPIKITFDQSSIRTSPLTQTEYDAKKAALAHRSYSVAGRQIPKPGKSTVPDPRR